MDPSYMKGTYGKIIPISNENCKKIVKIWDSNGTFDASGLREYIFYKRYYFRHVGPVDAQILEDPNTSQYNHTVVLTMPMGTQNLYHTKINPKEIPTVLWQITLQLRNMHKVGMGHYDLKSGNIILINGRWTIIDFGTSYIRPSNTLTTYSYAPPEAFKIGPTNPSRDMWGLGCILYEMITGKILMENMNTLEDIVKAFKSGIYLDIRNAIQKISNIKYATLLGMLLCPSDRRATSSQVLDYIHATWPDCSNGLDISDFDLIYITSGTRWKPPNLKIHDYIADQYCELEIDINYQDVIDYIKSFDT